MPEEVLKVTKIVFLLQSIVGIVFGLFFVLGAEMFFILYSWPYEAPVFCRLLGIDFIALAFLLLLSYRESEWVKIKNIVLFAIVWAGLNSIGFIILQFVFTLPLINWSNIALYLTFTVIYCYVYIQQQK